MYIFGVIILAALLLEYALELISNILNLRALRLDIPPELAGIYKTEDYRKSQKYLRANTRFDFVTSTLSLVVLLAFWFSGGFNYVDVMVRGWGLVPIINGLLYIGFLLLAYSLFSLPFHIYSTFVIEERFGFNRTTAATFILDTLKGFALSLVLGAPLLAGVLALFIYAGNFAWLYCWLVVAIYSLVMQYVAPIWFMPLFNKFTPMPPGELRDSIMSYTRSVDFPVKNVFVMDGSKRSSKSNAFFAGIGRNKRIALFDTLIAQHTVPELVAILAHEVGHYKKKHILLVTILGLLHTGLLLFLFSIFLRSPGLYQAFYMQQSSLYAGLLFFGLLYTPIELFLSVLTAILSRHNEYQADRFAVQTTADPAGMIDALKKLHANNLSNLTPHPFLVFLSYFHPPLLQRLRAIKAIQVLTGRYTLSNSVH